MKSPKRYRWEQKVKMGYIKGHYKKIHGWYCPGKPDNTVKTHEGWLALGRVVRRGAEAAVKFESGSFRKNWYSFKDTHFLTLRTIKRQEVERERANERRGQPYRQDRVRMIVDGRMNEYRAAWAAYLESINESDPDTNPFYGRNEK